MAKSICSGYAFNSGTSPCPFDPAKIKAVILATSQAAFVDTANYDIRSSESELQQAAHYTRSGGERVYPINGIVNYESSGGEAQTSQVGYGATRITGYSEKQMTFTLDHYDFNLRSTLAEARGTQFYVLFVDSDNRVYGLEEAANTSIGGIKGVPVSNIALGGQDFATTDPAALQFTLYINDYEDVLKNLRWSQWDYDVEAACEGLVFVDTKFSTAIGGVALEVFEHYSGENISAYVADMLTAASATAVLGQTITAVAYKDYTDSITLTTAAAPTDFTGFADSATLYTNGIFGIEQW